MAICQALGFYPVDRYHTYESHSGGLLHAIFHTFKKLAQLIWRNKSFGRVGLFLPGPSFHFDGAAQCRRWQCLKTNTVALHLYQMGAIHYKICIDSHEILVVVLQSPCMWILSSSKPREVALLTKHSSTVEKCSLNISAMSARSSTTSPCFREVSLRNYFVS